MFFGSGMHSATSTCACYTQITSYDVPQRSLSLCVPFAEVFWTCHLHALSTEVEEVCNTRMLMQRS